MTNEYNFEDFCRAINRMSKEFCLDENTFKVKCHKNSLGQDGKSERGKAIGHKIIVKGRYAETQEAVSIAKRFGFRFKQVYPLAFRVKCYCIQSK